MFNEQFGCGAVTTEGGGKVRNDRKETAVRATKYHNKIKSKGLTGVLMESVETEVREQKSAWQNAIEYGIDICQPEYSLTLLLLIA